MTNTELNLDQLTAIAGGVQMGPDGKSCTDRHIWQSLQEIFGEGNGTSVIHPDFRNTSNTSSLRGKTTEAK